MKLAFIIFIEEKRREKNCLRNEWNKWNVGDLSKWSSREQANKKKQTQNNIEIKPKQQ